ncbi:MAG TPA: hypothetical protein DF774_02565 [Rheinheimera sp.]|uniref:hypothetical protein n=1 Tax=Rheinheimera sp. TaxID=1869214 RepID=UPI000EC4825B|nr:hypothetical protein [Rheinheimera sp.]HCU64624.1 hypothetical protein [Rheinheimera sp.]
MKISTAVLITGQAGLLVVILLFVANIPAVEQFNAQQCQQMQQELDDNRNTQRRGYSLKNADALKAAEQSLSQQIYHHCVKPIASPSPGTKNRIFPVKRKPYEYTDNRGADAVMSARQFFASAVEVRAPYQGRQLTEWLKYYQEPRSCFGVQQTSQIVECVNNRQKAQQRFEAQWQQQRLQILSDQRTQ